MSNRVEGGGAVIETDEKRFYMPGVKIYSNCPDCGKERVHDLSSDYLSYPSFNTIEPVPFYCGDCDGPNGDCEWDVDCVLEFNLRLAGNRDYEK